MSAAQNAAAPPALLLAGPTGAGKSGLALQIAQAFNGSIINMDSRQIYRDFPIITAQPTPEEQAAVPHLGYGFLDCAVKMTAGAYARRAAELAATVQGQGRLPILVGGTGLYIQALLDGIADIPEVPPEISRYWQLRLAEQGAPALHRELEGKDPAYAAKIHPNDSQRISRALEVHLATRRPFSWWHAQTAHTTQPALAGVRVLRLGVGMSLPELTPRLQARIGLMLSRGAVQEAEAALRSCADRQAPGWSGIGCAELYAYLQQELSLEEAGALWLKNTRAYAKRQLTWFRRDRQMTWFGPEQFSAAIQAVRDFL